MLPSCERKIFAITGSTSNEVAGPSRGREDDGGVELLELLVIATHNIRNWYMYLSASRKIATSTLAKRLLKFFNFRWVAIMRGSRLDSLSLEEEKQRNRRR